MINSQGMSRPNGVKSALKLSLFDGVEVFRDEAQRWKSGGPLGCLTAECRGITGGFGAGPVR
jgi:hypothetical protein